MSSLPIRLGLIWGFDIQGQDARPLHEEALASPPAPGTLRWVHFNLADQRSRRWIADNITLPPPARDAMLAPDVHQRALIEDDVVVCTFHDLQREFTETEPPKMTPVGVLLAPGLVVTARVHPVQCGDLVRSRIERGARPADPGAALDLLLSAILEVAHTSTFDLTATVQRAEDGLLDHSHSPDQRTLSAVRRSGVLLTRQMGGLRAVLQRLEEDEDLPEGLLPAIVRLAQRTAALGADVQAMQSNLRQLREELDLLQAQRANQNLYVLSVLSAVLLPATLVTGIFGMNTPGLPFEHSPAGGAIAILMAAGAALGVYVWLRGLFRR